MISVYSVTILRLPLFFFVFLFAVHSLLHPPLLISVILPPNHPPVLNCTTLHLSEKYLEASDNRVKLYGPRPPVALYNYARD